MHTYKASIEKTSGNANRGTALPDQNKASPNLCCEEKEITNKFKRIIARGRDMETFIA